VTSTSKALAKEIPNSSVWHRNFISGQVFNKEAALSVGTILGNLVAEQRARLSRSILPRGKALNSQRSRIIQLERRPNLQALVTTNLTAFVRQKNPELERLDLAKS
jgi:hypothetical protein